MLWSQAFETSGGVHIVASAQWDKSRTERVVAIDRQGALHATQRGSVASGNVDQLTATFRDLQRDDIAEFQFQVRPCAWVEFKDVSLRPGEQTNVWVETGLSEKTDYAYVVVEEGVGFDGLVVGDTTCTAALIRSKLGEPDEERKSKETGWWLDYRKRYGLDFWLRLETGSLAEIRCNRGFKGRLRSGISMASTRADVFRVYGRPLEEKTVLDLTKHFDNQILYKRKGLLRRPKNSKIFYKQNGLLFWFEGEKVLQIVIHPKQPQGTARADHSLRRDVTDLEARIESATRLSDLGKALLIYANDHDDRFPEQLSDLRDEVKVGMSWLLENVTYLGKDMSPIDRPSRVLAYDKTLLTSGVGTNVLYLDSHVAFEEAEKLAKVGIKPEPKSAEEIWEEAATQARVTMLGNLKRLALAAIMYADEHSDTFANDLREFEPYVQDKTLSAWARENVEYVAGGAKWTGGAEASKKPLAYWKKPSATVGGTAVVFQDGHAEFVKGSRLKELGIEIQPQGDR